MTDQEFQELQPGDVVQHASAERRPGRPMWMVSANYGDHVTGMGTVDMTNPSEWLLISKVVKRKPVDG